MKFLARIFSPDRLLSLVIEPAEASAVIGDLLEERVRHGQLWFWRHVLETFAVSALRQFALYPWAIVKAGARSLWQMSISFVVSLIIMAVIDSFEIPHYLRHPDQLWGFRPFLMAAFILPGLAGGLKAALLRPGRELAVAVVGNLAAVPLFFATLILAFDGLGLLLHFTWPNGTSLSLLPPMLAQTAGAFAMGAMTARNYRLKYGPAKGASLA